jgi:hypothetical protein
MPQPALNESARTLFDRLLTLSREAHESGLHEVAYHALTAAMHAAQIGRDSAGVATIADEAREQIKWIDTHVPEHRLSTRSARKHDHPGVYAMLGRQAEMVARMLGREGGEERGAVGV